ncbi:MAG: RNA methyltransferase [Firmicutes bacterium]|nr:RNA methyltransferase [Bacillota bacterium]
MITSSDNTTFKMLKSLTTKKGRRDFNMCIIEGEKLLFENLDIVSQVFIRDDYTITPNLLDLEPIIISMKLFNQITDLDNSPGILATVEKPPPVKNANSITPPKGRTLILDRIQDPGNMGTILRTAAAFGFNTIYTIDCADVYSQRVIRSAMGQQFKLEIKEIEINDISQLDTELLIADMGGRELGTVGENFALVLGNEGTGIHPDIKKFPHRIVTIPMQNGVESLNVAVSGAILMNMLSREEL